MDEFTEDMYVIAGRVQIRSFLAQDAFDGGQEGGVDFTPLHPDPLERTLLLSKCARLIAENLLFYALTETHVSDSDEERFIVESYEEWRRLVHNYDSPAKRLSDVPEAQRMIHGFIAKEAVKKVRECGHKV